MPAGAASASAAVQQQRAARAAGPRRRQPCPAAAARRPRLVSRPRNPPRPRAAQKEAGAPGLDSPPGAAAAAPGAEEDEDDRLRPEFEELSDEQVNELVEAAAGLISVLPELRPLDRATFNAGYEVWKAIAAVPPGDRYRILEELDPGAIRNLWKASVGRYALGEARAAKIYSDYTIWSDLPVSPGDVVTYAGICEKLRPELARPAVPGAPPGLLPAAGADAWLQPRPGAWRLPQRRFTQRLFRCARTGKLHSRVSLRFAGPLEAFWAPIYNTIDVGLVLTPVEADAGADLVMCYPWTDAGSRPLDLGKSDLPSPLWPAPPARGHGWSPFSRSGRDYARVAGPGVLVGCAYAAGEDGGLTEDEFVYFALARVG